MKECWIGIVGNVGPEADEILQKYLRIEMQKRGALNDQDYLPMIVVKNPKITDRTAAIFYNGVSPAIGIIESCNILKKCGIYFAALPSNTSHYFYEKFQTQTDVYIIHLLDITSEYLAKNKTDKIALLSTTPTIKTGIYEKSCAKYGIKIYILPEDMQENYVQNAIYGTLPIGKSHNERLADGLKSGNHEVSFARIEKAVKHFYDVYNIEKILLGCTEIPIILPLLQKAFPKIEFIDPMAILAKKTIEIKEMIDLKLKNNEKGKELNVLTLQSVSDIADYVIYKMSSSPQTLHK